MWRRLKNLWRLSGYTIKKDNLFRGFDALEPQKFTLERDIPSVKKPATIVDMEKPIDLFPSEEI